MKNTIKAISALSLLQLSIAKESYNLSAANELAHFKSKNSDKYAINSYASPNYAASPNLKTHTEEKKPEVINIHSEEINQNSVPAGFEGINNNHNGAVTLLDNYTTIGDGDIIYNEAEDSIRLSNKAQQKIVKYYYNRLTKQGKINLMSDLKHKMPATSHLAKFYEAKSDNKATCHFDYNNLSLYILLPNKYLKNNTIQYKHNLRHPEPTFHTPSFKSKMYAYYDHYSSYNKTRWETSGSAASGKTSFIYNINNTIDDHVNDLYVEYHGEKYTYDFGYKEPSLTSVVMPYGNVWGFFMTENPKLINSKFYSSYKAPLYITVTKPYYVDIKYRGNILYKGTLMQGENVIETNNFPLGTYNITITKRDLVTDAVEETTEVFSQQGSRYSWLYSGLKVITGLESEYFTTAFTDKKLYFHTQKGYNIFKSEGEADIFYTFANNTSYIGAGYSYISSKNSDYSIAASLSQYADLYFSANSSYTSGKSKYSANVYSGFSSNFSSTRSKYARVQYDYKEGDWQLNIYGNYDFANSHTLASTISKNLHMHDTPISTYFTLQYGNDSSLRYLVGLNINFNINKRTTSNTSIRHASSDGDFSINNTTRYNNNEKDFILTNTLYLGVNSNNYNLTSAEYNTDIAKYTGEVNINQGDDGNGINTASFGIRTNFYLTPSAWVFSPINTDAGYIVKTPTIANDSKTKFIVKNQTAKQGETILVSGYSFNYNNIDITPSSINYSLKRKHWNEFFYPNNFYTPHTELEKTCIASFYADIPKEYNFTLLGMEDDFFGHGQQKSMAHIADGTKLTYIYLNHNNEKCATNTVVHCNKQHVDLGKVSCKKSKK